MRADNLRESFRYALAGLAYVLRTQRNFRVHSCLGLVVFIAGAILGLSWLELAVLVGVIMAVLLAELLNTIIETAVDLVAPEYHPLAKIAKDVAAGAVLLMAFGAVLIGLLVFVPHIIAEARLLGLL